MILEHARYLRDRARLDAFGRALAEVVRDGQVVLDFGAGSGVLGMLACRAGAGHVYAVEADPIAAVAREIVRTNGFSDRITVIRGRVQDITLPRRADVLVGDQIGRFGIDDDIVALWGSARERVLAPHGVVIPAGLDVRIAPVEHAGLARRLHAWRGRAAGFDVAALRRMILNTLHPVKLRPAHLLGPPATACSVDLAAEALIPLRTQTVLAIERSGVLHGIGAWFEARMSPSVRMTNAPDAADAIRRRPACFPVAEPVPVKAGDTVAVALRLLPSAPVYAWNVTVSTGNRVRASFRHNTLEGSPIDPADVRRPDAIPRLTPYGEARASVFAMCNGRATAAEIEHAVYERHRALFSSKADAAAFVAGVLARNARRES